MSDYSLRNSLLACKNLTRSSKSNFSPAFSLLPGAKREAMHVLYAYTRFTDDLVDRPEIAPHTGQIISVGTQQKLEKLNRWAGALESVLGVPGGSPAMIETAEDETGFLHLAEEFPDCKGLVYLPALKMIVDRFRIPLEPLYHLLDGVESDIEPQTFETFDDCADYCHQVATSVGFASLAIWGTTEPLFSDPVVRAAKACGIAFQWTNILRDLVEDDAQGRIYLPHSELQRFGLTEKQFGSLLDRKTWNEEKRRPKDLAEHQRYAFDEMVRRMEGFEDKFNRLLSHQFDRCEIYYTNSAPLYQLIRSDSRKVYGMMWSRYYALYRKLRSNPLRLTREKVRLSAFQKLRLLLRWKLLPCRRLGRSVSQALEM